MGLAAAPEAHTSGDLVDIERAQIAQARLRPNPRLYLSSEDLQPWANNFSFPNNTEDFGYFGENFEIDGKRRKRIGYADARVQRAEAEHQFSLGVLSSGIANAYWAAAYAEQAVRLWHQQLADFDQLVQYQQDRVRDGATAGVDLLRTQVERDRIALSAAQAERDAELARIELARRTASLSAQTAVLTDPLEQERPVATRTLSDAVEQRADVVAARAAVSQAQADLRLQHADAVPDLNFFAGYKRDVGADTAYGGFQVDLPFFNRNQGGIALASAGTQLAADQLAYTRLSASSAIASAAVAYTREQQLVHTALPGMSDRAVENASILNDAYRSGGADLLRFLDAERVLIETRLLSLETWAEYQRAVVALHLAYGEQP